MIKWWLRVDQPIFKIRLVCSFFFTYTGMMTSWSTIDQQMISWWSSVDKRMINWWLTVDQLIINRWSTVNKLIINSWSAKIKDVAVCLFVCFLLQIHRSDDEQLVNWLLPGDQQIINWWSEVDQLRSTVHHQILKIYLLQ